MFFSKLPLVFLATILGISCGARNGYPYPQSNGPIGYRLPLPNGLPGYPYPQSDGSSGHPSSQPNGRTGYPYPLDKGPSGHSLPEPNNQWLPVTPSPGLQDNNRYTRCVCTEFSGGIGYPYAQSK
ncbi:GSCOCT00013042001.2-RA-CDS [Cotesia congregata]|uniref:Cc_single_6.1b n=1 Tax=Cotesia congregata TaxID=51543 RepID=S6D2T4_COTCN|nr:GSCOCT00013042001.2-RA-CDS [Cotesia congregata]CAG5092348.1 cc_single_6.1b [Cotesia congregata]CCQ71098.1 hypothetical protein CcBV_6.1B [Cotesia congregata]